MRNEPLSRRLTAFIAAALLVTACTDDSGLAPWELLPVLETADSVTAGHPIDLVAVNPGSAYFSYGACAFAIERKEEGAWVRAWPSPGIVCAAVAISFAPGAGFALRLPGMVTDGEHRITLHVKESDSEIRHVVVSNPFIVRSSGPAVLEVLDDTVDSGTTVRVRFRNRGAETLAFDACNSGEFETQGGRGWHSFGRSWPCVAMPDSLVAGEVRVVAVPIPSWDHVRYGVRYAIDLTRPGGVTTFANTGPFWIRGP